MCIVLAWNEDLSLDSSSDSKTEACQALVICNFKLLYFPSLQLEKIKI